MKRLPVFIFLLLLCVASVQAVMVLPNVLPVNASSITYVPSNLYEVLIIGNSAGNLSIKEIGKLEASDGSYIGFAEFDSFTDINKSIVIYNNQSFEAGEISFILGGFQGGKYRTNIVTQMGKNNSAGLWGNSLMILPNTHIQDLGNNASLGTNCYEAYDFYNKTRFLDCDTQGQGASLMVQGWLDVWGNTRILGELTNFGGTTILNDFNAISNDTSIDFDISGSPIHIRQPRVEEEGFLTGEEVIRLNKDFNGGDINGQCRVITDVVGDWQLSADAECVDDFCIHATSNDNEETIYECDVDGLNVGFENISFYIDTVDYTVASGATFTVSIGNSTTNTTLYQISDASALGTQSVAIPSAYDNQSNLNVYFSHTSTNPAVGEIYLDNILINSTATANTLQNVTYFDSIIKFGDGSTSLNGLPLYGIYFNDTDDTINFIGNVTQVDVTLVNQNVTGDVEAGSFTLNGTTIDDWSDVNLSTSPAGSDTQIQFNDGGSFGATPDMVWNNSKKGIVLGTSNGDSGVYLDGGDAGMEKVFDALDIKNDDGDIILKPKALVGNVQFNGASIFGFGKFASSPGAEMVFQATDSATFLTADMRLGYSFFGNGFYLYAPDTLTGNNLKIGTTTYPIEAIYIGDNNKMIYGNGQDSEVYFDGTNMIYNITAGGLHIFDGGNISVDGIIYNSIIDNSSSPLEWFEDGNDYINPNGSINHNYFKECKVEQQVTDYLRPEYKTIYITIQNESYIDDAISNGFILYENNTYVKQEAYYPHKTIKNGYSAECVSAKQTNVLSQLNKNMNLYNNLTDFDVGIMAENIYTQSKVIDINTEYATKFLNASLLDSKLTHKNKETLNLSEFTTEDVLNMEDRIVDLEGAMSDIMNCMFLHEKYDDARLCVLDTTAKVKVK